jgi:septum site-determining protein MinC
VTSVTIRGTSEGLIISLGPGPLHDVLEEMEDRLSSQASFFRGGRVALHSGERALSEEQLCTIGNLLEGLGVTLWAVQTEHPSTETAARELGLEIRAHPGIPHTVQSPVPAPPEEAPDLVVRRTLRSGQAIYHVGSVVVIGDVNPGAEIVAGGNIVVWGKLRGTAHAGAADDDAALICALQLMPSQIRIGSFIACPPDRSRPPRVPEVAHVQKGHIVVERWDRMG